MSAPDTTPRENPPAVDGRLPGRRGRATRQRLLDETRALLDEVSYRELRVVDISRRAGTSPATFYQYFPDVDAAVLSLVDSMVDDGSRRLRALVTEPDWDDPAAASALAEGFLRFFEHHQSMLRVVDLAATEGDERFHQLRVRLLNGVFLALQELVYESQAGGCDDGKPEPGGAAGVLTAMLAHVSAHVPGYAAWGISRQALADAMASYVRWSVAGPPPASESGES
ncbi:MAG: TetR family transcriptional regulator [Acidimicrobiales bacterium]